MIYLLDDKKNRQLDYGWNDSRFKKYSDYVLPIYFYKDIEKEEIRREIFTSGNIVLLHESFFDNVLNQHPKLAVDIRKRLTKFSSDDNNSNS